MASSFCFLLVISAKTYLFQVPVFEDKWTHDPFGAEEDEQGNIYARGAQDMKCVSIQYLEAIHRLIKRGFKPKRTVHVCFTPEEEIGSIGMMHFVETDAFKKLNVGCELDEGVASPDESYELYYGERTSYKFVITCEGTAGHGSLLLDDTAGEKITYVCNKVMERRAAEKKKLKDNPSLTLGDVTTINLTILQGGVQENVVPPELKVIFDCRVSLSEDHAKLEQWLRNVCKEAGKGVTLQVPDRKKKIEPSKIDNSNPWWVALKTQFEKLNMDVKTRIFPAATDARYLRNLGVPAFGFSPMNKTPILLHDHDEYLNKDVFLRGIEIYEHLIPALANV